MLLDYTTQNCQLPTILTYKNGNLIRFDLREGGKCNWEEGEEGPQSEAGCSGE